MTDEQPTISTRRVHTGRVIDLNVDTVRFPNGTVGELEIVRHPGASAIVPFASDPTGPDPQLVLMRQYRYAAGGVIYEIPAGRLDPGESPVVCAGRELLEETGCTAGHLEHLFTMLTTPGFSDERIHVFMATDLKHGQTAHEADEFITTQVMPLSQVLALIRDGTICDAKTALAILYVSGFMLGR
jgi:ADP-ribose pyrophosphatase